MLWLSICNSAFSTIQWEDASCSSTLDFNFHLDFKKLNSHLVMQLTAKQYEMQENFTTLKPIHILRESVKKKYTYKYITLNLCIFVGAKRSRKSTYFSKKIVMSRESIEYSNTMNPIESSSNSRKDSQMKMSCR